MSKTGGELIQVPVSSFEAALIADAARIAKQSSEGFALAAALAKAQETVLDQTLFILTDDEFSALEKALDEPADCDPAFAKLLSSSPPWVC